MARASTPFHQNVILIPLIASCSLFAEDLVVKNEPRSKIKTASSHLETSASLLKSAHPCTFCQKQRPGNVKLEASFLIWQSKEWGLEFASKSFVPSSPTAAEENFKQKLFVPDFSWSPGCKVDFGFNLPRDGWDVDSRWTFYHGDFTNLKKHFDLQTSPTGLGIVPLWHYPFIDFSSTSAPLRFLNAAGNWKLFFNSFDLNLGRAFTPRKSTIFRMSLGAKGSWIRQHYHVEYNDSTTVSGIFQTLPEQTLQYTQSHMVFHSHAWGLGPRSALESKWRFGWGFALVADTAMSLLSSFSNLKTRFSDQVHNITANESLNYQLHMKRHIWELIPVFEGKIGIDWGTCFNLKRSPWYLGMQIAYEFQYWWAQNHSQRNFAFQAPGNMWDMRGDLQMHGLTASIQTDF